MLVIADVPASMLFVRGVFDWQTFAPYGPNAAFDATTCQLQSVRGLFLGDADPVARVVVGEWRQDMQVDSVEGADADSNVTLEKRFDDGFECDLLLLFGEVDGVALHKVPGAL